jgi:c-di-GMP-binding flagellar brake protein YcgR
MNYIKDKVLTSVNAAQRRKDKRINSAHLVDYATGPMEYSRMSQTLSVGGIFISTPSPLPVETHIWMRIHLDSTNDEYINVEGVVRYCQPKRGMGVKFLNINPEDKKRIEARVEKHWWQEV